MQLIIHRGTKEIGGSCVELEYKNSRIIIDLGMPLSDGRGNNFDYSKQKSLTIDQLIAEMILPNIEGLYKPAKRKIDAILISHPHFDHYGLLKYILPAIPVYISEPTLQIVEINNLFTPNITKIKNPIFFPANTEFPIRQFNVKAFLNDHSSFVSYSFLIEAGGKTVFYSGDFRSHGRKGKSFYWFLHNCPQSVDALLMEGTTIGKGKSKFISETEIEKKFVQIFKHESKINLVYTSSQNIDRLVSIYKACKQTQKKFVIDFYTATVLKILSQYASIPFPSRSFPEIMVYYPKHLSDRISKQGHKEILYQFKNYKITKEEIDSEHDRIVLLVRPTTKFDLERLNNLDGGNFIYSQWEGYRTKDIKTAKFINYLTSRGMRGVYLHTSGHADISALQKYVDKLNPKKLIPIHTITPILYKDLFKVQVKCLKDGQSCKL